MLLVGSIENGIGEMFSHISVRLFSSEQASWIIYHHYPDLFIGDARLFESRNNVAGERGHLVKGPVHALSMQSVCFGHSFFYERVNQKSNKNERCYHKNKCNGGSEKDHEPSIRHCQGLAEGPL